MRQPKPLRFAAILGLAVALVFTGCTRDAPKNSAPPPPSPSPASSFAPGAPPPSPPGGQAVPPPGQPTSATDKWGVVPEAWPLDGSLHMDELGKQIDQALAEGAKPLELYRVSEYAVAILEQIEFDADTTLVDFGTGTGVFTVALLQSGRPFKKLYAVDVIEPVLKLQQMVLDKTRLEGREKVEMVASRWDDAKLPPESADLILKINVPLNIGPSIEASSGFLANPKDPQLLCMRSLVKAMRPDAELHDYFGLAEDGRDFTPKAQELLQKFYQAAGLRKVSLTMGPLWFDHHNQRTNLDHMHGVYVRVDKTGR
ncbi:MAG: class I SAM-dependent methyltransferase [Deltaproteobacteria bacterium]|nr:class I SAM-dependent methyltransferase [Deltaproteobacteria bacterium]